MESHSAITITAKIPSEDCFTNIDEKNVYETIKNRFLATFSKNECICEQTKIIVSCGKYSVNINGVVLKQKGWMEFDTITDMKDKILPNLQIGDVLQAQWSAKECTTTPPKKVTEISLAKYLEAPFKKEDTSLDEEYRMILDGLEIGTQATRTQIALNAVNIGYITLSKGKYSISQKGRDLIQALDSVKINLYAERTVVFSNELKNVYKNIRTVDEVVKMFSNEILQCILGNKQTEISVTSSNQMNDKKKIAYGNCPLCGAPVYKNSKSYYCSNWKEGCKFSIGINDRFFASLNKKVTDTIVKDLLNKGKTRQSLISKRTGNPYKVDISIESAVPLRFATKIVNK